MRRREGREEREWRGRWKERGREEGKGRREMGGVGGKEGELRRKRGREKVKNRRGRRRREGGGRVPGPITARNSEQHSLESAFQARPRLELQPGHWKTRQTPSPSSPQGGVGHPKTRLIEHEKVAQTWHQVLLLY